jgi:hypothetical protein
MNLIDWRTMSDKDNLTQYLLNEWDMPLLPTVSLVIPMAELLPPNPFEKEGEKIVVDLLAYPKSVADLLDLPDEEAEESNDEETSKDNDPVILAKAIKDFYDDPTAFGAELFSQGSHDNVNINYKPQPTGLHLAARKGDLQEITKLLKAGVPINSEDHLSSTALHVATMFGKTEAAILLMKNGANIHDLSYNGLSAFQLAVDNGHYKTAASLVVHGQLKPNHPNFKGDNPIKIIFDVFYQKMISKDLADMKPETIRDIHELLSTIEVLAAHSGKYCHYTVKVEGENTRTGVKFNDFIKSPLTMQLKSYAIYAPTDELRNKILQTANKIFETDKSEVPYLNAKNLLQTFPTGGLYYLKIGAGDKMIIQANGHFKLFTTELVKNSLAVYLEKLHAQHADPIQIAVFEKILETYTNAYEFLSKLGTQAALDHYLALYESGKTILIPSGWNEHFATHFASLPQKVVGVGNSGDRYATLAPGVHFYKSEKLGIDFIKAMAINQDKQQFEYNKMYEYGIIEKIGTLPAAEQKYGSCTLESHRDAVEGMALIEITNIDPNLKAHALPLAHHFFEGWNDFLGDYQLAEYQKSEAGLPVFGLIDIFNEIHLKPAGKFTAHHQEQAKKVIDILLSPAYQGEFKYWLTNDSYSEKGQQIKQLFSGYGLDVCDKATPGIKLTASDFHNAITQFKTGKINKSLETQNEHESTADDVCHAPFSLESQIPAMDHPVAEIF